VQGDFTVNYGGQPHHGGLHGAMVAYQSHNDATESSSSDSESQTSDTTSDSSEEDRRICKGRSSQNHHQAEPKKVSKPTKATAKKR